MSTKPTKAKRTSAAVQKRPSLSVEVQRSSQELRKAKAASSNWNSMKKRFSTELEAFEEELLVQ